jgi:hypothetical protein
MFDVVKRVWRAISSIFEGADLSYGGRTPLPKKAADDELERSDRNFERFETAGEVVETIGDVHDHPAEAAHIIEHAGISHLEGTPGALIWDVEHGGGDFIADAGSGLLGMVAKIFRNVAMRVLMDRHGGSEPADPRASLLIGLPKRSALRHTVSDSEVFGTDAPPPPGPK